MDKMWGVAKGIVSRDTVAVSMATIRDGGYSSRHTHHNSDNVFIVVSGTLRVIQYFDGGVNLDTVLSAGSDPLVVGKGIMHQFFALSDCECIEVYSDSGNYVSVSDIVRWTKGGADWRQDLMM